MSRVLVTGASGFIGSHLRRRLVEDGADVHAVSRYDQVDESVRWWRADVSHADATAAVIRGSRPDIIFHLAGYVSGSRDLDALLPALHANLVGSVNVMLAAARCGAPVVIAGSMEEPDASAQPVPVSPYAAAKYPIGAYARMLHTLHGLDVAILRLFMVYGPAQTDYTKLLPYVITSLLRAEQPLLSSGTRPVDWVFVGDVVDAFVAAASSPRVFSAQTLDVGSGELVTIHEVVELVADIVGRGIAPEFGTTRDRPLEMIRLADVARTAEVLNWRPTTNLPDGLRTTIEWYANHAERLSIEKGAL